MKLAFSGQARYADYDAGYELYTKRSKAGKSVDKKTYKKIVRLYCKFLADKLAAIGMADLPCDLGMIAAAFIPRKPQFRGEKFVGYGKVDWTTGQFDGSTKAFGIVFIPRRRAKQNLRCYGFVANRKLFRAIKRISDSVDCPWKPMAFTDDMI